MAGDGEQVQPWLLGPVRRVQRWQFGSTTHWQSRHVTLGQLADGRWLVEHSDVRVDSRAYRREQRARQVAAELTAGDGWREVPAEFGGDGNPTSPGWYRSGGAWLRGDRSQDAPEQG